ncbi:MAG: hypothetical protein ACJATA_001158 [Sphingobacteriales bacterium]|jgi:hypothetical protein
MLYREIKGILLLVTLVFVIKFSFKVDSSLEVKENVEFATPSKTITFKSPPRISSVFLPN